MSTPPTPPRAPAIPQLRGLVALLALLALLTIAPALIQGRPAGDGGVDAMGSYWFQWWVGRSVAIGAPLDHTDLLFFPWGKNILTDTGGNLVDAALGALFGRLFGPVGGYNALILLILTSNGLATAQLRPAERGRERLAAALVGLLHPFALTELAAGRPAQALLAPAVLALGLADRGLGPQGRLREAVGAGLLLGLAGHVYWYGGLFFALAIGLLGLWHRAPLRLGALALAAALVAAPVALPLLQALHAGQIAGLLPVADWLGGGRSITNAAGDPLQLCVLASPCTVDFVSDLGARPIGAALGLLSLPLALLAGQAGRRWLAIGALAVGISLGPWVGAVENPLYLGLTALMPPMARLYWPCRSLALLMPLGALGAAAGIGRLQQPWATRGLALLGLLLLGDAARVGRWPLSTWTVEVAPAWRCLPPDGGGVIALPYGVDHQGLLAQTVHQLPQLGGMNERSKAQAPAAQQALRTDNPWLRALLTATSDASDRSPWTPGDRDAVGALGLRWVVVRWEAVPAAQQRSHRGAVERRLAALLGPPLRRGEELSIYAPWGGALSCPTD